MVKQSATPDSSFWINSHRSGLLAHVLMRFEIHYAPEVAAELRDDFASGREFWRLAREGVIEKAAPQQDFVRAFGPGERAAMNLTIEHPDWILLMDDRRPLEEAQRRGIRTICTPVFVTQLYAGGDLSGQQALDTLATLAAMQTVSPALIDVALAQLAAYRTEKEKPHGN